MAANTRLIATFVWEHGIGWTELRVTGKGINQTIKLSGARCAYKP
jgi:hypothetical protein